ncbi:MAG: hypothetical protein R2883_04455 [Caldisericia bacterium]
MKRISTFLIVLILSFTLISCSSNNQSSETKGNHDSIERNYHSKYFDLHLPDGWVVIEEEYSDEIENYYCIFGNDEETEEVEINLSYGWKLDEQGNKLTFDGIVDFYTDIMPDDKRISDKKIDNINFARFIGQYSDPSGEYDFDSVSYEGLKDNGSIHLKMSYVKYNGAALLEDSYYSRGAKDILESVIFHDFDTDNIDWRGKELFYYNIDWTGDEE